MSYETVLLAMTPTGYWQLGETVGSTTVADSSGNGLTATKSGSPTLGAATIVPGAGTTSCSLPGGGNDGFATGTSALFSIGTSDFTIIAWFKGTDSSENQVIVGNASSSFGVFGGKVHHPIVGAGNTTITDGSPHMLVVSRLGGSCQIYVDGVLDNTPSTNATAIGGDNAVSLGFFLVAPGYGVHGLVAHISIHSSVGLSGTQITALFVAGGTSPPLVPNGNIVVETATASEIALNFPYASGVPPVTVAWKRATSYGGSQTTLANGSGISGVGTANLIDASPGLTANTLYYYQAIATDSATPTPSSITSFIRAAQLGAASQTFVAIGDSTSTGVGGGGLGDTNEPQNSAIQHTARNVRSFNSAYRNVTVLNQSIGGTASADWISSSANFATALAAAGGSFANMWVFIRLGVNDFQANVLASTFGINMASLVGAVVSHSGNVMLSYPTYREPGLYGQDGVTNFADGCIPGILGYLPYLDALVDNIHVFPGDHVSWPMSIMFPQYYDYWGSPFTPQSDPGAIHPNEFGTEMMGFQEAKAWLTVQGLLATGTFPTSAQVLNGIGFGPTDNLVGTVVLPSASQVISTATFGPSSGTSGTLILPTVAQVISTATFGPGFDLTGTVILPNVNQVEAGITFGPGSDLTGTYTSGGGGTYPTAAQVLTGIGFGPTDNLVGTVVLPSASQVISTATFGPSSGTSGTVVIPTVSQVEAGITYGPASDLTGTYAGGGGGVTLMQLDAALAPLATATALASLNALVASNTLPPGAVVVGSTVSAVIVSGLPSGRNYVTQHLVHLLSGEARTIAGQSYAGGNYTLSFTGTAGTEAGPFSAVATADAVTVAP
jgi:lysophospholipase L1-like esterase